MAGRERETLVDRWLRRAKNNRVLALVVAIGIVIAGIAKFTSALGDLLDFVDRLDGQSTSVDASVSRALEATRNQSMPCAGASGAAAIHAYALALVDSKGLAAFVRGNAILFAEDGRAIECLRELADDLNADLASSSLRQDVPFPEPVRTLTSAAIEREENFLLLRHLEDLLQALPAVSTGRYWDGLNPKPSNFAAGSVNADSVQSQIASVELDMRRRLHLFLPDQPTDPSSNIQP